MTGGATLAALALIQLMGSGAGNVRPVALAASGPITLCGVTADRPAAFEAKVAALPGIERAPDANGYRVYFDNPNMRIWNFTTEQIPGHPAAICRSVVAKGEGSEIVTEISCGGSQTDCRAIADAFEALNKSLLGER